jgi:steroid delta-isomerase-like uncharacterized protein
MTETTSVEHRQVIERYIKAFNEQELDVLPEVVTDDIHVQGLIGTDGNVHGIEEYREWWREALSGVPDAHLDLTDYFESGDRAATRWIFTGSHEHEMFGIPATNRSFEVTGLSLFRMENGKIAQKLYQQDDHLMLQQLGILEGE